MRHEFQVKGTPVPKPQNMTKNSHWQHKEKIKRYRNWQDRVRDAWEDNCGKRYKWLILSCVFGIAGFRRVDMSNLIKSIEDSLKDYDVRKNGKVLASRSFAIEDDDIDHIYYGEMKANRICATCSNYNGKSCEIGRIENCPKAGVFITLEGEEEC